MTHDAIIIIITTPQQYSNNSPTGIHTPWHFCCLHCQNKRIMSNKSPNDVVIVSALRTPLCRSRKGALAEVPGSTLLQAVFQATLAKTKVAGQDIEDICLGNCLMPAAGFAAMRMAQIVSGIPDSVPLHWVNRQCSSGLQAVAHVANAIAAGQIEIGLGGGVETMTANPM
jgi:acetyl-CoA acyltransferase 1